MTGTLVGSAWEPESRIPQSVVVEYESGKKIETIPLIKQVRTVVTTASTVESSMIKKARTEQNRVILDGHTGYVDLKLHNFD